MTHVAPGSSTAGCFLCQEAARHSVPAAPAQLSSRGQVRRLLPSCLVGRGAAQASAQLFSRGPRASADWSPTLLPGDVATSCCLGIVDAVSDIQNETSVTVA